jgi:hypothetical protein
MKRLKPLFANVKSVATLIVLAAVILIGGFIATKTLFFAGKLKESSPSSSLNASAGDRSVEVNSNDSPPASYSTPVVSTRDPGFTSGNPNVTVWVNTSSGVYHCPNTRWYGNTKNGKYMTQQEAQAKGYRPAYGTVCG